MSARYTLLALLVSSFLLAGCHAGHEPSEEYEHRLTEFAEQTKWLKDLPAPAGTTVHCCAGGGSVDSRFWTLEVEGAESRDRVADFYDDQLSTLGWESVGDQSLSPVFLHAYHYYDGDERPWHALLVVSDGIELPSYTSVLIRTTRLADSVNARTNSR